MRPCLCKHIEPSLLLLSLNDTKDNRQLMTSMCQPCCPPVVAHLLTDEPVDLAACCGMAPAMWGMKVTLIADLLLWLLWLLLLRRLCSQVMQLLLLLLLMVML